MVYLVILVFSAIGVFSLRNNEVDVYLVALFGVLGHSGSDDGGTPARHPAAFTR